MDPRTLRLPAQQLVLFSRQLAILFNAGVDIVSALESLAAGAEGEALRFVCTTILLEISRGKPLSAAFSTFPLVFPKVFLAVVRVGENSGRLNAALNRLADWLERDMRTRQRVRSALTYPTFVLSFTAALTLFLFYSVLPGLLAGLDPEQEHLPVFTRMLMALVHAIRHPGFWLISLAVGGESLLLLRRWRSRPESAPELAAVLLRLPALGPLLRASSLSRFCGSLEAMVTVGGNLLTSLGLAAETSGNPLLNLEMKAVIQEVREGELLQRSLESRPDIFPRVLAQLVACGEETGNMRQMLVYLEGWFAQEVRYRIEILEALVEPLLLSVVALVVAAVIVGVFLPLYGSLGSLGG